MGPRPAWTDAENLAFHRDSIPGQSSPQPIRYTDYSAVAVLLLLLSRSELYHMQWLRDIVATWSSLHRLVIY